ncbi:hypothetical protein DCS_05002 [Drechmeria coniospora]|uniref:Uncharacterized protein n=1 Tax=Drechmeria coniospora TaxID=98403 RepID=A0A151GLK9_DRECN|nr:hypothetical protein DCS_05002 [Drechmeria coniospora]KYK57989.1 hypothetical protein DCS_05002 [Drechmeria coniospora]
MKLTISVLLLGALATSVVATAIPDIGQEADIAEEGVSTLEEKAGLADPARATAEAACQLPRTAAVTAGAAGASISAGDV